MKKQYIQAKQVNKIIQDLVQCPYCLRYQRSLKIYIYNRDKFTCRVCKRQEDELEIDNFLTIHHIIAQCNGWEYRIETIENTVTWCHYCHKEYNQRNPNPRIQNGVYARVS